MGTLQILSMGNDELSGDWLDFQLNWLNAKENILSVLTVLLYDQNTCTMWRMLLGGEAHAGPVSRDQESSAWKPCCCAVYVVLLPCPVPEDRSPEHVRYKVENTDKSQQMSFTIFRVYGALLFCKYFYKSFYSVVTHHSQQERTRMTNAALKCKWSERIRSAFSTSFYF